MCDQCEQARDGKICELCDKAAERKKAIVKMSDEDFLNDIGDFVQTGGFTDDDNYAIANALYAIRRHMMGAIYDNEDFHYLAWAMWGQELADLMYPEVSR